MHVQKYTKHAISLARYSYAMSDDIFIATGLSQGERIRLARLAKWLRQIDVASQAGVTLGEVCNCEKDRYVTPDRKARILKVVGLLDDDDEDKNRQRN